MTYTGRLTVDFPAVHDLDNLNDKLLTLDTVDDPIVSNPIGIESIKFGLESLTDIRILG